jgi:hypothetical protein
MPSAVESDITRGHELLHEDVNRAAQNPSQVGKRWVLRRSPLLDKKGSPVMVATNDPHHWRDAAALGDLNQLTG